MTLSRLVGDRQVIAAATVIERVAGFDRDEGYRPKCPRQGVAIEGVESAFHDEVWVFPDFAPSGQETCFQGIGRTAAARIVFVAFIADACPARADLADRTVAMKRRNPGCTRLYDVSHA